MDPLTPQYTPVPSAVAAVAQPTLDLNGTWKFIEKAPETPASETDLDRWKDIQVPGEWFMQGFDVAEGDAAGYGRGFEPPSDWAGHRIKLLFDGVYSDCRVFVNGCDLGGHVGGFTPFEIDVTGAVRAGERNVLALSVKNESLADSLASGSSYACHPLGGVEALRPAAPRQEGVRELYVSGDYQEAKGTFVLRFAKDGTFTVTTDFQVKEEIQPRQLGVVFDLPPAFTTLVWQRDGYWDSYPEDHIGRSRGTAKGGGGRGGDLRGTGRRTRARMAARPRSTGLSRLLLDQTQYPSGFVGQRRRYRIPPPRRRRPALPCLDRRRGSPLACRPLFKRRQ